MAKAPGTCEGLSRAHYAARIPVSQVREHLVVRLAVNGRAGPLQTIQQALLVLVGLSFLMNHDPVLDNLVIQIDRVCVTSTRPRPKARACLHAQHGQAWKMDSAWR
jgi:hypothetical protein